MTRRIEAGAVIAAIGAVMVLVSLFLDWFEPDLSAWTTFELVDLLLAAIALAVLVESVLRLAGASTAAGRALHDRWLPIGAAAALALVVATLINHPPAAIDRDLESGIWIALAGALVLALGVISDRAHVSLSFTVKPTEPGVPEPGSEPPAPASGDTETRPLPARER